VNEIGFVRKLQEIVKEDHAGALVLKPNDQKTIGIPDLLIFWAGRAYAIEAKVARGVPRNKDALWLDHDFTGPQVVTLRQLAANDIPAIGLIYVANTGECAAIRAMELKIGMSFSYVGEAGVPFSLERGSDILGRITTIHNGARQ
jgi:hypothetical protein